MVALVVSVIVLGFALSLLLTSYSLFSSANKQFSDIRARELAQSAVEELTAELTEVDFDTYAEQLAAHETKLRDEKKYSLWFYVRYNMFQNNWPYYDEDESNTGHGLNAAGKYFDLNADQLADDIKVNMYWEKDDSQRDGARLWIRVTVTVGDATYTAKRVLELQVDKYPDVSSKTAEAASANLTINPAANRILKYERWRWNLYDR